MIEKIEQTEKIIRDLFNTKEFIPLHEPIFQGNEKKYLNECIDSTFVSSAGKFIDQFERMICEVTGSPYAVATMNGTAALHIAMLAAGVKREDEVITQALTFVATCNAVSYIGASPIFVDVNKETMGMCPNALRKFLDEHTKVIDGKCVNNKTGKIIKAIVPMHTFGHPAQVDHLLEICNEYKLVLVEDSAESIGSLFKNKHTGTFGKLGVFSFNGNKVVTSGGGGVIITEDEDLAKWMKHVTTTAKIAHPYEYIHSEIGYNYRLTNLSAALACAQLEQLETFQNSKRELASEYSKKFKEIDINFFTEPLEAKSNYWFNTIILENEKERNLFLEELNKRKVMCRPVWRLMNKLDMFKNSQTDSLENSQWLEERIVNIPSSANWGKHV